jgi:hypothetical protein
MPLWPRCSASIKRSPRSRDTQRQGRLQLLVGRLAFVPAAQARQMALSHGSVWRRLVVDPLTGAALDLSTRRYRPTRAMADLIAARDGMCRGPGCTVPAERCDLDHDIPSPSGPTAITNLSRKHRRHHNHKTRGTWTATTADDGAITWRTRAKRRYVTHPRGRSRSAVQAGHRTGHRTSPRRGPTAVLTCECRVAHQLRPAHPPKPHLTDRRVPNRQWPADKLGVPSSP